MCVFCQEKEDITESTTRRKEFFLWWWNSNWWWEPMRWAFHRARVWNKVIFLLDLLLSETETSVFNRQKCVCVLCVLCLCVCVCVFSKRDITESTTRRKEFFCDDEILIDDENPWDEPSTETTRVWNIHIYVRTSATYLLYTLSFQNLNLWDTDTHTLLYRVVVRHQKKVINIFYYQYIVFGTNNGGWIYTI